ncbi:flagellar assembly protein FliH [uncultured Microbulbifer sp.]|uniref:flagellar assembly protein FliH n=1 Tax=uncultured Microbulbifer sp. TaxID=348147 RepID=UPI002631E27D|nr:flagellar assembly protein FliH [uncultured Microbulbifer sp.]
MSEAVSWRRWQPDDFTGARERRDSVQRSLTSELDALREQARAEGRKQGYEAGYAEGYECGQKEGRRAGTEETIQQRQALLTPLNDLVQNFNDALTSLDGEIADDISALALVIGRHLADEALNAQPQYVCHLVRTLLREESTIGDKPRLWLHPEDLNLVEATLGNELTSAGWRLEQDPRTTRGSCRVTTSSGELDATRETRWQEILKRVRPLAPESSDATHAEEQDAKKNGEHP